MKHADTLKKVLADSYTLYLKTQNYHWNVTGSKFRELHLMFEEQYTDLAAAVDLLAERIRSLGEKAPGTFKTFLSLTSIKEGDENTSADGMLEDLYNDQLTILASLKKAFQAAGKAGDEVTVGMLTERMQIHEKNAWMLAATLGKEPKSLSEVA